MGLQDAVGSGLAALNVGTLKNLVVVRLACAGAEGLTRAQLRRDLAPLVQHRLSNAAWRDELDALLMGLVDDQLVSSRKLRLLVTPHGQMEADRFVGLPVTARSVWSEVRDVHLVARALGLGKARGTRRKRLSSTAGLRSAILESTLGVRSGASASAAEVRGALAVRAGARRVSNAAESRRIAANVLRRPREFESDTALVAEVAAEQVGALQTGAASLRLAVLRRFLARKERNAPRRTRVEPPPITARLVAALSAQPPGVSPDAARFTAEVGRVARSCAEGWPGNRRAFVSSVWQSLSEARPEWGLDEATYKRWLVEAHVAGMLTLGYADLRDASDIERVRASAIRYQNTEWHFIRVED
jgi:hypothetical protein